MADPMRIVLVLQATWGSAMIDVVSITSLVIIFVCICLRFSEPTS